MHIELNINETGKVQSVPEYIVSTYVLYSFAFWMLLAKMDIAHGPTTQALT
jgi:hypothetical protein